MRRRGIGPADGRLTEARGSMGRNGRLRQIERRLLERALYAELKHH